MMFRKVEQPSCGNGMGIEGCVIRGDSQRDGSCYPQLMVHVIHSLRDFTNAILVFSF